jgi:hypothetical protein
MPANSRKLSQPCCGDNCDCVSDEVIDAVFDCLKRIPGGEDTTQGRDDRAIDLAPRMAAEGWRFCPCYPLLRTEEHERIFDLVHTNLANRLANRELQAIAIAATAALYTAAHTRSLNRASLANPVRRRPPPGEKTSAR